MSWLTKLLKTVVVASSLVIGYGLIAPPINEYSFTKGRDSRIKSILKTDSQTTIDDAVKKHLTIKKYVSKPDLSGDLLEFKVMHVDGSNTTDPSWTQGFCIGYSDKNNIVTNLSLIDKLQKYLPDQVPDFMRGFIFNNLMDAVYLQNDKMPFSQNRLMKGFSDGSHVELRRMHHLMNLPKFMYACTSCAVSGDYTDDGKMKVLRRLDLDPASGFHNFPLGIIFHNEDKNSYFISTFSGVPWALAGYNDRGIVITQVGQKSKKSNSFLDGSGVSLFSTLTSILGFANSLDDAKVILRNCKSQIGFNGVIADLTTNTSFAYEVVPNIDKRIDFDDPLVYPNYAHFFNDLDTYEIARVGIENPPKPIKGAVFRGSLPMDDYIRQFNVDRGDLKRYYGISNVLDPDNNRKIDFKVTNETMFEIEKQTGDEMNMMDLLIAGDGIYVRYAKGKTENFVPAVKRPYVFISHDDIFGKRRLF